ncbi:MAG: hypothetical protein ABIK65_11830 [Candidatus Eisenbacteria bacterium]
MNRLWTLILPILLSSCLLVPGPAESADGPSVGAARVLPEKTPAGTYGGPPARRLIGDTIEQPFLVPALPFDTYGSTCGFAHDYDEMCPYGGYSGPDVVYALTPTEYQKIRIDLCRSSYDTKVYVYKDGFTPGAPYACNDDACGADGYRSLIDFLDVEPGHVYYIVIDAYSNECGNYDLRISDTWECPIACPPEALPEGEPVCYDGYDDQFNSGCSADPTAFWMVDPSPEPVLICGESGTYVYYDLDYRDTDWYEINPERPCTLLVTCDAEFLVSLMLIEVIDHCWEYELVDYDLPPFCLPATIERVLDPGRYWIWVAPQVFDGIPCGSRYLLTIDGYRPVPTGVAEDIFGTAPYLGAAPNPFNPSITIAFDLPRPGNVRLTAHGPGGRLVERIASGPFAAGSHEVLWAGTSTAGRSAGPGVYFLRLETEDGVSTKKVVLLD